MNGNYKIPSFLSAECRDFISCILQTDPYHRFKVADIRAHPWYNSVQTKPLKGTVLGKDEVSLDADALARVKKLYDFEELDVACAVRANQFNEMTTTYYIMQIRLLRTKMFMQNLG